jgi:uncharacterized membrane protein YkvA (DUF1232 family)
MSFFVNRFLKGKWFAKSNSILSNKKKVMLVLATLRKYMKSGGLKKVSKDLALLADYVSDIIQGHYHNYNKSSIILALAGLIYVVSPIDFLPDFLPLGFLDDITIITWAITKIAGELSKYSQWKNTLITHPSGLDDIEEVPYEEID